MADADADADPGLPEEDTSPSRLERYEEASNTPLLVMAFGYLVIFSVEVLWVELPPEVASYLGLAGLVLWLMFVLDFVLRVALARKHLRYLAMHPLDLLVILLPALRTLRVLRVFTALRLMVTRGQRIEFPYVWLGIVVSMGLIVYVGALVVLDVERGAPNAQILNFPQALWWGFFTITAAGCGNFCPVTPIGQLTAVFVMIFGVALLGTVTGTIAAWFAQRMRDQAQAGEDFMREEMAAIREDLREIRDRLS